MFGNSMMMKRNEVDFGPRAIVIVNATSPFIHAYAWNNATGFGAKFANPSVGLSGAGTGVAVTSTGDAVVASHANTPFISGYPFNINTGFGTKYANPTSLANTGRGVDLSPNGDVVVLGHAGTIRASSWAFNSVTGFGARGSSPSSQRDSSGGRLKYNHAGTRVAVAENNVDPFGVSAVLFNMPFSGFGSNIAFISTPSSAATVTGIAWHPTDLAIAITNNTFEANSLTLRAVNANGTLGTNYALPSSGGLQLFGCAFNNAGSFLALGSTNGLIVASFNLVSGIGATIANPVAMPNVAHSRMEFSADDSVFAVLDNSFAYIGVYAWNNATGFGAKYANPSVALANSTLGELAWIN